MLNVSRNIRFFEDNAILMLWIEQSLRHMRVVRASMGKAWRELVHCAANEESMEKQPF